MTHEKYKHILIVFQILNLECTFRMSRKCLNGEGGYGIDFAKKVSITCLLRAYYCGCLNRCRPGADTIVYSGPQMTLAVFLRMR